MCVDSVAGPCCLCLCASAMRGYALLVAVAILANAGCIPTMVTLSSAIVRTPHEMNQTTWLEVVSWSVRAAEIFVMNIGERNALSFIHAARG